MRASRVRSVPFVVGLLLAVMVSVSPPAGAGTPGPVRLFGSERIGTSIALSQDIWADGGATGVALARHDNYPDALAGAPLAIALGGPLLLTTPDGLWPDTGWEIMRILPAGSPVVLLGGVAALSEDVAWDLVDLGYDVYRADGATRYHTSVEVARATTDVPSAIFLADGNDFPAAMIAGAAAGAIGGTVVLSQGASLPDPVADYLDLYPTTRWIAVGPAASTALPGADDHIVGVDIYDDSRILAETIWGATDSVAVASGQNFPDGLAGGAHAGMLGMPLLLSPWDTVTDEVWTFLQNNAPVTFGYLYGGTAALSDQVYNDVWAAM